MNIGDIRQRVARTVAVPAADGNFYSDTAQAIQDRADLLDALDHIAILCVRHPDASNEFTISAPLGIDVVVIDADYGGNFDSYPRNAEEGEVAVDMADSLTAQAAVLPDGDPVKEAVADIATELLAYAVDLDVDVDAVREDIKTMQEASAARLAARA